jgi:hypothetical protein
MPSSKTEKRFIQSRYFIVAEPAGVGVVYSYVVMIDFEENKGERERVELTNRKWYWKGWWW